MYMTLREKNDFAIKKTRHGKGIVARKHFRQDKILFQFSGKLITCEEDDAIDAKTRSNTIRFDADMYLSPAGRIGDFLNHSCSPNAKVVKKDGKLLIVAIAPIPKSEEITIDYSTVIAADDVWKMECGCESLHCRSLIGRFKDLPKKLQKEYIASAIVPKYIVDISL